MAGFDWDNAGMSALKGQLDRVHDDLSGGKKYITNNADLDFGSEGLIMRVTGPHKRAYDNMVGAMMTFDNYVTSCSQAVEDCRKHYAEVEKTNKSALDAEDKKIKGPADPKDLKGLAYDHNKGRPKAFSWSAFADVKEPSNNYTRPDVEEESEDWSFDVKKDLLSPSAYVRSAVLSISHVDIFAYVTTFITGEWASFVKCGIVWGNIGKAFGDMSDNLTRAAADTPNAWKGNAAEAAQEKFVLGAKEMNKMPDACKKYAKLYNDLAAAVKDSFSMIEGLLTGLVDAVVTEIIADAVGTITVETVVGGVIGYGIGAFYISKIIEIVLQIKSAMDKIQTFVDRGTAVIDGTKVDPNPPKLPTGLPTK